MTAFDRAWDLVKADGPRIEPYDLCMGCGDPISEADAEESQVDEMPFCWACREVGHPNDNYEALMEWITSMGGKE